MRWLWIGVLLFPGCATSSPEEGRKPLPLIRFQTDGEVRHIDALDRALLKKRWNRAVQIVAAILKSGRLVPEEGPDPSETGSLIAPERYLIRRLTSLPDEFYREYRLAFDPRVDESGKIDAEIWERYFFATGMDVRGDRLANELFERGDTYSAHEIWNTLLKHYPKLTIPRRTIVARSSKAGGLLLAASSRAKPLPARTSFRTRFSDKGWDLVLVRERAALQILNAESDLNPRRFLSLFRIAAVWSRDRMLWVTSGGWSGLVDLSANRRLWLGPTERAPVPGQWLRRGLGLLPPPSGRVEGTPVFIR